MPRKKKRKPGSRGEEESALPRVPERLAIPFADALSGMKPAAKAPPSPRTSTPNTQRPVRRRTASNTAKPAPDYSYEDRVAYHQAYSGVSPLAGRPRGARRSTLPHRPPRGDDEAARRRLAQLVAGGLRFRVTRDDGWVEAVREKGAARALGDLHHGRATPEAEVDLHGMRVAAALRGLVEFLKEARQTGRRVVRVIHGKGLHSDGGVGVLGDAVVTEMTEGSAAPLVLALSTCSIPQGGAGAVLVRLDVP